MVKHDLPFHPSMDNVLIASDIAWYKYNEEQIK